MRPNIALVGRAGAGKSTIAAFLTNVLNGYGYRRHSWAAPVRAIFAMAYGDDVLDPGFYPHVKESRFAVTGPTGPEYRTGRELLQRIGTEAIRENVDRDFWIKAGIRSLAGPGPFVNDDTRFPNEAAALERMGWWVVRVERPGLGDTGGHPSETEQAGIEVDLVVINDRPIGLVVDRMLAGIDRIHRGDMAAMGGSR